MFHKCREAVDEIMADPDMKIRFVVGDMPARHTMKGVVSHTGKRGCEVCIGEARTEPIRWPYQTSMEKPFRTKRGMERVLRYY